MEEVEVRYEVSVCWTENMAAVVTTYLEMTSPPALKGQKVQVGDQSFEVRELKRPDWLFNREMYLAVGADWKWIDKKPWTEAQWKEYANDPNLRTFAGYYQKEIAGYYELHRSFIRDDQSRVTGQRDGSEVEIAYFGLLPGFIGRGIGGGLLTSAIENAWAWLPSPVRVWVHTCNHDHQNALANYQARGFRVYNVEEGCE